MRVRHLVLDEEVIDTGERVEPYDQCRCQRGLVCSECHNPPGDCDCSDLYDDLLEDEDDPPDDPLVRTLLGLPSGIRCGVVIRSTKELT